MNTCKEKRCPPLALQIRAMDSSFDAFCKEVRMGNASCDECPCYFCHPGKMILSTEQLALSGYHENQEIQFASKQRLVHREEVHEFIFHESNCMVTGRKKCTSGKGNNKCYLICAAFQAKVKRGKMSSEALKQLGIDPNKTTSPEESAAKHGILLSLLNVSPALFSSSLRFIDVWEGEVCLYTEHSDFYKRGVPIKRIEKYDRYIGNVLMLPKFLRKKKWNSYHNMCEYFSDCGVTDCENCWEAKNCGKDKCLIKSKLSGQSCWVTPELCSKNKNEWIPWLYKYNCWKCEFYKKPQRMLSLKKPFLN